MQRFYAQQVAENLDDANSNEISEQLIPLWLATQQAISDCPQVEDSFRFYYGVTLKELCTMVAPKMPSAAPELPGGAMKAPEMPKMNPQDVQLSQMQGFNPLKAAQQMMSQPMGSMPQMPGVPPMGMGVPPMGAQMPGVPPMGAGVPPMGAQMPGVPPMGAGVPPMGAQMPGVPPMGVPPVMPGAATPPFPTQKDE